MAPAFSGRQRMPAAFARREPNCVPVSPDISAMVPVRLAGRPFDEMCLDGLPHHGYASTGVAQAYVDAVKYYGLDGWDIYGPLPKIAPEDRPGWESRFDRLPSRGQIRRQAARTPHGELVRRTIFPFDLLLHATPAQVAGKARLLIDDCASGGGFVLSTGDQCGRDTPDASLFALVEVARTYGRYR